MVKANYLIQKVLKKPDLTRMMVFWAVAFSDYDIQYIPRGIIKSHVLTNFLGEFSSPVSEEVAHTWILFIDSASNLKEEAPK